MPGHATASGLPVEPGGAPLGHGASATFDTVPGRSGAASTDASSVTAESGCEDEDPPHAAAMTKIQARISIGLHGLWGLEICRECRHPESWAMQTSRYLLVLLSACGFEV